MSSTFDLAGSQVLRYGRGRRRLLSGRDFVLASAHVWFGGEAKQGEFSREWFLQFNSTYVITKHTSILPKPLI